MLILNPTLDLYLPKLMWPTDKKKRLETPVLQHYTYTVDLEINGISWRQRVFSERLLIFNLKTARPFLAGNKWYCGSQWKLFEKNEEELTGFKKTNFYVFRRNGSNKKRYILHSPAKCPPNFSRVEESVNDYVKQKPVFVSQLLLLYFEWGKNMHNK